MHCTFKKQLKDWIEESQLGTDCENKHWCTDIQDSTIISDITKYKKKKKAPEMTCVQAVQRAATQSKGSLTSFPESAVRSSLIICVELIQFFFLMPYHQSPKAAGGLWNLLLCLGCSLLSQEHTTSRPVPCSWESVGWRKTIYRNSNISKKQRHHAVLLIASVKRHLNDTSLELVLQGGEKPWAENKWADLCVIFAEGIISALSTASCSSSVW